ncbi:SDR family oxidoreductase [uncultured Leifsonia sp.]|uniref:SDR family oxidoreductase n=1 Tax=uncultured Leifsonia sp. TaxID=340359 RepID=UPI0028D34891|nr:SDR family oxidoreductase [uncultured Leifsonia sp.]
MRVFVTGASGWIGSAVVPELVAAGHQVTGLARSEASAERISAAGARPHPGSLDDLESIRSGAAAADAVIHLGFRHDFTDYAASGRTERAVVQTIGDELAGSGRGFLFASGVAATPGRVLTEEDPSPYTGPDAPRGGGEALAFEYADRHVRPVALRFAPTVHGAGDHGFTAVLVGVARERGVAAWIGDGENRWPAVHRLDAARLVRLALEQAPAGGIVHAIGEEGIPTRAIAEAIGAGLGVPTASIAREEAAEHFGWIGGFFGMDIPASSALTRERYGWEPTGPTLLEDLAAGSYFAVAAAR